MSLKPDSESAFGDWIASLGDKLTPDEIAIMRRTFEKNDAARQHVVNTVMMRSDYGRQTLDQKREYEAKLAQLAQQAQHLNELDNQLTQWQQYVQQNTVPADQYQQIQAEVAQLQQYRNATEAKIRSLGLDELVNSAEIEYADSNDQQSQPTQGRPTMPQNPANPFQTPNAPFATQALVDRKFNEVAVGAVMGQATIMDMDDEYRALTGKPLPNRAMLMAEAIQANKPIADYIAEKFQFDDLRSAKIKADNEAEIARRVNEEVARRASQQQLPTPGSGLSQSPVMSQTMQAMNMTREQREQNVPLFAKPGQAGRAAQAATEAFLSRKYKDERFSPFTG